MYNETKPVLVRCYSQIGDCCEECGKHIEHRQNCWILLPKTFNYHPNVSSEKEIWDERKGVFCSRNHARRNAS